MKKYNLILKIISSLQIAGGVLGLLLIAEMLINTGSINGALLLIFMFGLSLFIFSIRAGVGLLRNEKYGALLTIINQCLQIVHWRMLGYGLSYSSAFEFVVGIKDGGPNFNIGLMKSNFAMFIRSDGAFTMQLNMVAIAMLAIVIISIYNNKVQKKVDMIVAEKPVLEDIA
ncbi:hypothetical protein LT679_01360 [Mucilaginibacter roseus]|uniref:Uncharacterized protein n=1 Tax=Mucilaginibacter roseus TaxID=1528868 RepID=A0ABS8TZJ9_9SPHI|nr:hypothetical protein [Mucilaginibacter roseus]MCD8739235.1 hypothetical protein [Mucilaginibacter roseus]